LNPSAERAVERGQFLTCRFQGEVARSQLFIVKEGHLPAVGASRNY